MAIDDDEISDTNLLGLVIAAEEESLAEGIPPRQRGLATVRKVL
jgi:hypothetical protein